MIVMTKKIKRTKPNSLSLFHDGNLNKKLFMLFWLLGGLGVGGLSKSVKKGKNVMIFSGNVE